MRHALLSCLASLTIAASARAAAPFDPLQVAGVAGRPGAQVPMDLPFRDEAGRRVTLRQLGHGQPIVLAPVQHHCPNICGVTLGGLAQAMDGQGLRPGRDFQLVAFGIDPREGPVAAAASVDHLRTALAGHSPDGVHALTGAAPDIAAVTGALGYRYAWDPALGQYAHMAATAVLTPDGRLSAWLYGVQPPPELLKASLAAAGAGRLGALGDRLLLLCYHYDPRTGRYGPLAFDLLRGGAGLVVIGLAGFVGVSLLRERRRRAAAS
jgi:protein SCO1/2